MLPDYYFKKLEAAVREYDKAVDEGRPALQFFNEILLIVLAHLPDVVREIERARGQTIVRTHNYGVLGVREADPKLAEPKQLVATERALKMAADAMQALAIVQEYAARHRDKFSSGAPGPAAAFGQIAEYVNGVFLLGVNKTESPK